MSKQIKRPHFMAFAQGYPRRSLINRERLESKLPRDKAAEYNRQQMDI